MPLLAGLVAIVVFASLKAAPLECVVAAALAATATAVL